MGMEKDIQVIQDKADQIYEKFKSFFAFQEGDTTFWDAFDAEVNEFKERTEGLDESKILSMIRDPTKPLSNMNPLSDDEDLLSVEVRHPAIVPCTKVIFYGKIILNIFQF